MERRIGIIVSGATGRMGRMHHLPALLAIRAEGGLKLTDGSRLMPEPMLVGRDAARLGALAASLGVARHTTDLDRTLADPDFEIFFDTAATEIRPDVVGRAIAAGKHVYCEKPVAHSTAQGLALLRAAEAQGVKHGAVEDKLHQPGIRKLRHLRDSGFFGRIHRFHLEFGRWIFDGKDVACQRSSWNYRAASHGGILLDMFPHWRYVVEHVAGPIEGIAATVATATPERIDETGRAYEVDVEDTASCLLRLGDGALGTISSSWATRVRREEVFQIQVDGSEGSAVAGYQSCFAQAASLTPRVMSEIGGATGEDHRAGWLEVPTLWDAIDTYRAGWEEFLRHVAEDAPMRSDLRAGVRDVAFGELTRRAASEGKWVDFPGDAALA